MSRDEKQEEIFQQIIQDKCHSVTICCTGFGKTRIATKVIKRVQSFNYKTTVVVPTLKLKDQWTKVLKDLKLINWEIFVINTYVKQESYTTDLLIIDECHHCLSVDALWFNKVLTLTNRKHELLLSATLTEEQIAITQSFGIKIAGIVTIREALLNGWISPYIHYNWYIDFNDQDRAEYEGINKKFNSFFAFFDHDFDKAMACMKKSNAQEYYPNNSNAQFNAILFNRAMQGRKKFLYEASCKIDAVHQLVNKFPDRRTIIFSESTEFANNITQRLGDICLSYHSNLKTQIVNGKKLGVKRLLEYNLKRLQDNRTKIRVVSTAKALNEGFDYPNLSLGIIASGTGTPRIEAQRVGRLTRIVEGKRALIVDIIIKDTQDESWARKRQLGLKGIIPVYGIDEIEI